MGNMYPVAGSRPTGVSILGLVMVSTSGLHRLSTLAPVMLIGGAAWVVFVSLINALVQSLAPDWVRARVLAVFILVYQGGFALGSAAWGAIAQRASVGTALVCAGVGIIASLVLALFAKLPDSVADLSPWNHWRMPIVVKDGVSVSDPEQGPVLITVEYFVIPERSVEFVETIHLFERIRRRDGASQWGIYRDTEAGDRLRHLWALDQARNHRLGRRALKCARRSNRRDRAVDAQRMQPMKITGDRQQHHGRTLKDLAYADDGLTIKAVCHMSNQESQQRALAKTAPAPPYRAQRYYASAHTSASQQQQLPSGTTTSSICARARTVRTMVLEILILPLQFAFDLPYPSYRYDYI
jgi:Transmembrane secretion effector